MISTPFTMFFLFPYFHIFHIFNFLFRACGKGKQRAFQDFRNCLTILKVYFKTQMCPRPSSVPLTISYHLDFLRISLKFGAYLHHGSMGRVQSKECYFKCTLTFQSFFVVFCFSFLSFQSFPLLNKNNTLKISRS